MDLDSAAEELYGVPADEFAEHRTRLAAQAKAAGDKALAASIGKLRKPVLAAALVNELVRGEPAELQELSDLGEQMRTAHRNLRGPELRALSEQRQQLLQRLTELVRETAEQGGRSVTEPVLAQVRGTFDAAIADEAAEAAVLSGRLTVALSYTGFGEVDVTDAVAAPVRKRHLRAVPAGPDAPEKAGPKTGGKDGAEPAATKAGRASSAKSSASSAQGSGTAADGKRAAAGPASSAEQARQRRLQRQQEHLKRAEAEHAEAARALEQAEDEAATAGQRHQEASAQVEQLREQLEQAQEQAWAAGQARRSAERARLSAEEEADRTAAAVQAARRQLAKLESDLASEQEPD